jgi:hypothetical protein
LSDLESSISFSSLLNIHFVGAVYICAHIGGACARGGVGIWNDRPGDPMDDDVDGGHEMLLLMDRMTAEVDVTVDARATGAIRIGGVARIGSAGEVW